MAKVIIYEISTLTQFREQSITESKTSTNRDAELLLVAKQVSEHQPTLVFGDLQRCCMVENHPLVPKKLASCSIQEEVGDSTVLFMLKSLNSS